MVKPGKFLNQASQAPNKNILNHMVNVFVSTFIRYIYGTLIMNGRYYRRPRHNSKHMDYIKYAYKYCFTSSKALCNGPVQNAIQSGHSDSP